MQPLSSDLTRRVLAHLHVDVALPVQARVALSVLDSLLAAYTRTVPWESAFRIVRRARIADTADCPRWPEEFWLDAIHKGGGGTCFESNYAFFSLLRALGYDGYLTINNMGDKIGCHTAIVAQIGAERWLADVGLPIYTALPLDSHTVTERASPYMHYAVRPDREGRFQIERSPHPNPNCFTLIDRTVSDSDCRAAATNDYGPNGLFLNRVIVNKVIDGALHRFNSDELPPHIQVFRDGERRDDPITSDVARAVASRFGMDEATVRAALEAVGMDGGDVA